MNIPDHIFESLETIFWVELKILNSLTWNPGSGIFFTMDPRWGFENLDQG
jgi:hypothetical protein